MIGTRAFRILCGLTVLFWLAALGLYVADKVSLSGLFLLGGIPMLILGALVVGRSWTQDRRPGLVSASLVAVLLFGAALHLLTLGALDTTLDPQGTRLLWEARLWQHEENPCAWTLAENPRNDLNHDGLRFLAPSPDVRRCQPPGAVWAASLLDPLAEENGFVPGKILLLSTEALGLLIALVLVLRRRKPQERLAVWALAPVAFLPLLSGLPLSTLAMMPLALALLLLEFGWRRSAMPLLALATAFMPLTALLAVPVFWKYREESPSALATWFLAPVLAIWLPWLALAGPDGLTAIVFQPEGMAMSNPLFRLLDLKFSLAELDALRGSLLVAGVLWTLRYQPDRLWGMGATWTAVFITAPELTAAHVLLLLPFWVVYPSLGGLFLMVLWPLAGWVNDAWAFSLAVVTLTLSGFAVDTVLLLRRGPNRSWRGPDE